MRPVAFNRDLGLSIDPNVVDMCNADIITRTLSSDAFKPFRRSLPDYPDGIEPRPLWSLLVSPKPIDKLQHLLSLTAYGAHDILIQSKMSAAARRQKLAHESCTDIRRGKYNAISLRIINLSCRGISSAFIKSPQFPIVTCAPGHLRNVPHLVAKHMTTAWNFRLGRPCTALFNEVYQGRHLPTQYNELAHCLKCPANGHSGAVSEPHCLSVNGYHCSNCRRMGQRATSHTVARDKIWDLCQAAGISARRECLPPFVSLVDATGKREDRRLDIVCEDVPSAIFAEICPDTPLVSSHGTILIDFTRHNMLSEFTGGSLSRKAVVEGNMKAFYDIAEKDKHKTYDDIVKLGQDQGHTSSLLVANIAFHGGASPSLDRLILTLAKIIAKKKSLFITAAGNTIDIRNVAELQKKAVSHIISDFYLALQQATMTSLFRTASEHAHLLSKGIPPPVNDVTDHTVNPFDIRIH